MHFQRLERRKPEVRSSSYKDVSDEIATVEVVVSSGAFVYREERSPRGDIIPFYRGLEITPEAIRLDRLRSGAPVLDNHSENGSTGHVLGSVDDVWIEDGALIARLRLSKITKSDREIVSKIKNGIITAVSVGAEIHNQEDITTDNDNITRVMATDWEPYEISIVPVPADGESIIRNYLKGGLMTKKYEKRQENLEEDLEEEVEEVLEEEVSEDEMSFRRVADKTATEEDLQALRNMIDSYQSEVMVEDAEEVAEEIAEQVVEEMPGDATPEQEEAVVEAVEDALEEMAVASDMDEQEAEEVKDEVRKKLKKLLYKRRIPQMVRKKLTSVSQVSHDRAADDEKRRELRSHAVNSLASSFTSGIVKSGDDNPFAGMSMVQTCRELLYQSGKHEARNWSGGQVYEHIRSSRREVRSLGPFATTGDFSQLFTDSINKGVMESYESQRGLQTFKPFVTVRAVADFKELKRVQVGERGKLQEVAPGADAPINTISDRGEEFALKSYSTIFQLTRQGFINDDTGELQNILTSGAAAADIESDLVYTELHSGTVGGATAFSSGNNNLSTSSPLNSGSTPYAGLVAIHAGLARQTGLDVDTPLNLSFKYLIVPKQLEFAALQTKGVAYPAEPANPNPLAPVYEIISDARLDGNSATSYYGVAAEAGTTRPFIELAHLQGQRAPITKFEESFGNDVLSWKLTHDCAAKMLDYRLAHKCTA